MAGSHSSRGRKSRGSRAPGGRADSSGGRSSSRSGGRSSASTATQAGRSEIIPAVERGRRRQRSTAFPIPLRQRLPRTGNDPGDRLIGIGVILFAIGMVAVLAVFLPFWVGVNETGLLLGLAALLTVVGLGCALAGLYQQAKPRGDRR